MCCFSPYVDFANVTQTSCYSFISFLYNMFIYAVSLRIASLNLERIIFITYWFDVSRNLCNFSIFLFDALVLFRNTLGFFCFLQRVLFSYDWNSWTCSRIQFLEKEVTFKKFQWTNTYRLISSKNSFFKNLIWFSWREFSITCLFFFCMSFKYQKAVH